MLLRRLLKNNILISFIVTIISFLSVIPKINETIIGRESESTSGILIWTYKMAYPNISNLPNILFDRTGFPWGENLFTFSDITQLIPRAVLVVLNVTLTPIVAYNALILLIFFLNFHFTFRLIKYFTNYRYVNFVFTFMLTFSNYIFAKLSEHVIYTMQFIVAISFIMTLEFAKTPKISKLSKFLFFYSLAFYFDGYYPFILLPFFCVNVLMIITRIKILSLDFRNNRAKSFVNFFIIILTLTPIIVSFLYFRGSEYAPTRSIQDFQGFSGKIQYLWKLNDLNPLNSLISVPSIFLPDSIAATESVHFSLLQLLIIIILSVYLAYRIIFNKNFARKLDKVIDFQIHDSALRIILIIILFCFLFFIYIDLGSFGEYVKNPSEILFQLFPYWRVTARGLVVLEFAMTCLAIHLLEPLWDFKKKKISSYAFCAILSLASILQTGFHPYIQNYSVTNLSYDNIFHFMKTTGVSSKAVSLSSWNEFTGYGMWIVYSGIKVPNNFFEYSNFTSFYENSMSFADPQFLCHQKFLGSQYLAFLDVPNDLLKSFDSDNYVKVAKFESTRNPNNFDLLFKKSSKITSKSPIGYPSFERTSLQILNKDFSLFVIKSDKITIKIKDLPNSNSIRTSKLKLGVSTLYDSTIRIKRDDIILTFFTSTGKVTIIDLPVKLGDELLLTSIPKNFQRDNVTYISSPYLEGCYRK